MSGQITLLTAILDEFLPRFAPGGIVQHVADDELAHSHSVKIEGRGMMAGPTERMPDVLIWQPSLMRLFSVDDAASRGLMEPWRQDELAQLFAASPVVSIIISAIPSGEWLFGQAGEIAWGTHAWIADEPDHMIHFGGPLLGPHRPQR